MKSSEKPFSLRPATPDDLEAIAAIEGRVHVAPWTREHFSTELGKPYSCLWVLSDDETDSEIAGYIVFWKMFQEAHILNVAVDLPYRGLGFAKLMVRKVLSLAHRDSLEKILLEVRKSNLPAIHLYQGLGFGISQIRKGFYSDGEDAYLMTCASGASEANEI